MTTPNNTTNSTSSKGFPTTTSEVAKMLGIDGSSNSLPLGSFSNTDLPVANLPVAHEPEDSHSEDSTHTSNHEDLSNLEDIDSEKSSASSNKALAIFRVIAPYVAVFTVGLIAYYFFFTNVDFSSIFNSSTPKALTSKQTATQELIAQNLSSYKKWINAYYYDVTDSKITDPETDNSGNGLTNFQKYLLNLNPKAYDTLGLGKPDSETLATGIDPATGFNLTDAQKDILAKYIDMEVVMNRLTLNKLQHPEAVAGIGINSNGAIFNNPNTSTTNTAPNTGANLVGAGISINTDIPGRLEIPSLKINVPIIFTKDTNNFDSDLQSGVVHYPGTALPGEIGTSYIAGHSSNYIWAKGSYNHVFTKLGELANNTSFKVTVVQTNGKDAIFHYVVTYRDQYLATDQEQFRNMGKSLVALSTCWPINTTSKRLVVFGELTQTEY